MLTTATTRSSVYRAGISELCEAILAEKPLVGLRLRWTGREWGWSRREGKAGEGQARQTKGGCGAEREQGTELGESLASEGLAKAEEEVEVARLTQPLRRLRQIRVVIRHRVDWRVQVVAEVQSNGPGRGMVAQTKADGVGEVVKAARFPCIPVEVGLPGGVVGGFVSGDGRLAFFFQIRLMEVEEAGPCIRRSLQRRCPYRGRERR